MQTINIFIASSGTLKEERDEIEKFISRTNDKLIQSQVYLKTVLWEKQSAQFTKARKQEEFNSLVDESDFFICIIYDKVGKFTLEEFKRAYEGFSEKSKPNRLNVYFKDTPISPSQIGDLQSVNELKDTIKSYGQIWTYFQTPSELLLSLDREIQLLVETKKSSQSVIEDSSYEIEFVHTTLDIFDERAHISRLTKFQVLKALKPFQFLYDAVSVDGSVDIDSIYIDKGVSRKIGRAINWTEITTDLGYTVKTNDRITKTFSCLLIDSFGGRDEFWEDDNVNKCGFMKTTIVFPKERKYDSFSSKIIRGFDEIDTNKLVETFVDNRFALDIEFQIERLNDKLRTYWTW